MSLVQDMFLLAEVSTLLVLWQTLFETIVEGSCRYFKLGTGSLDRIIYKTICEATVPIL